MKSEGKKEVNMQIKEITLSDEERQPCEVWTRVMGYFRPVSQFNAGKKSEYAERQCFKESKIDAHPEPRASLFRVA